MFLSQIIEISASDGTDVNGGDCLMRGHFRDQLWGLASHPAKVKAARFFQQRCTVSSVKLLLMHCCTPIVASGPSKHSVYARFLLPSWIRLETPPPFGFDRIPQPVYATSGDEGMLKEWDVVALALKREIDLGGMPTE